MSAVDPKVYLNVLRVRQAYAFDVGGLLIRMFTAMTVLGVITMLTLAGWSFLMAGSVSTVIAFSTFAISPQISRLVDEWGQHRVVPAAGALAVVGALLMVLTVQLDWAYWLCYPAGILMAFVPNAQSLTRARWTYMVETGKLGELSPDIKTVFAYEGTIDDAAYMLGPSTSIALAAVLFPTAGMVLGSVCLVLGLLLLGSSRSTEPEVGWKSAEELELEAEAAKEAQTDKSGESGGSKRQRNMFLLSGMVRLMFVMQLMIGAFWSVHDTVLVSLGEYVGQASLVSVVLICASIVSILSGIVFGMLRIRWRLSSQMVVISACFGVAYGLLLLVHNVVGVMVVCTFSAVFYAPLVIVLNTMCERSVPKARLTESLTWMNAGFVCGTGLSPTLIGAAIDSWGAVSCLSIIGSASLCLFLVSLVCLPLVRRNLRT